MGLKGKTVILLSVLSFISILLIGWVTYYYGKTLTIEEILKVTNQRIEKDSLEIEQFISFATEDIRVIADTPPIQGIIRAKDNHGIDPLTGDKSRYWHERLEQIFTAFLTNHSEYFQLRYIDEKGNELVNAVSAGNSVKIISQGDLQNKAQYPYLTETIKLSEGEVYFSEVNLNREYGTIQVPHNPVLRIATPVYDNAKKICGIVIVNILASHIFSSIRSEVEGIRKYMINQDGFFLINPDKSKEFGFDLGNNFSILDVQPELADEMRFLDTSVKYHKRQKHFDGFKKIFFDPNNNNRYWALIYDIPERYVLEGLHKTRTTIIYTGFIIYGLFIIVITTIVSRNIVSPILKLVESAGRMEAGDLNSRLNENEVSNEFKILYRTINAFAKSQQTFAERMEQELAKKTTELVKANEETNRLNEELEQRIHHRTEQLYKLNIELEKEVSMHKDTEKALIVSKSRLLEAQNIAHIGNWEWNIEVNSLEWSDEIFRIFGFTPQEFKVTYEAFLNSVHPDDKELVKSAVSEALINRRPYNINHRIILSDGTERIVHEMAEVIFNKDGKAVRMVGTVQDITEQKKLEDQLRQAQKMEAVGQLAGGVAHDFNNILTAIIGYSSILKMKIERDHPFNQYLDHIIKASEKAASLTRDLLTFSRKQITNPKPVDINDIVRRMESLLIRLISADIELRMKLTGRDLSVMADSVQIEHAIMNLTTNAKDAMPAGGVLTIETDITELDEEFIKRHGSDSEQGQYALITVKDTGIGMDDETRKKIFEPFFTTKEVGKGTGLGLSMVYGIIKQHDGFINCLSETGIGTIFRIYLPLTAARASEREAEDTITQLTGGTETILIAEDDMIVRGLMKEILEEFGYKIIEAVNGEDSLNKFMQNADRINLLILDLMMPKKNGRQVYEEIKKIAPDIKTIFSSGYTANLIQQEDLVKAGMDFIAKPVSPSGLVLKVREVLDR